MLIIGLIILSLNGFKFQNIDRIKVAITIFRVDYSELESLISIMKIGKLPPEHSHTILDLYLSNTRCNYANNFYFSFANKNYKCPNDNRVFQVKINKTHSFECPTFCQVCPSVFKCSKTSLSGIMYTPDDRKKDKISFQYGTMDHQKPRPIDWLTFSCFVLVFTVVTNLIFYFFSDD